MKLLSVKIKNFFVKLNNIAFYSDSEPSELFIAFYTIFCLPMIIKHDLHSPWPLLMLTTFIVGLWQMYVVVGSANIRKRLIASKLSTIIIMVVSSNLYMEKAFTGSQLTLVLISLFAFWNVIRLTKEKFNVYE